MTTPVPPRRTRKPRKIVSDPARADEILESLRAAEFQIRELTERRRELIVEASDIGLTIAKISEAVGASQASVSSWVRTARKDREESA
ncbi:MAG: sigma-70 family RNA polymerase sigma factor [Actinobacteria bacterium]|nr:sigma-70 family RNA polymerase sigma factor [Actinomycetota bacterium]